MSAFIAFKFADGIHLLTDAAGYDHNGTLLTVMDKCWYSDRLPIAITGRGNAVLVESFAKAAIAFAGTATDIAEVKVWLDAALARLKARSHELMTAGAHFEIMTATFCEDAGFEMRAFCTHELSGLSVFEWRSYDGYLIGAPDIRSQDLIPLAAQIPVNDPRFLPAFGPQIMELMRKEVAGKVSMFHADATGGVVVGGNCRLTTVTRTGVTSQVLKEWSDPVGEPINPYREEGNIVPIGTRKERRAAKVAQRRKGAAA